MRRTSAQTREHVLEVARELFYRDGVRATGVDTVASRAGVAPTTLYRLFASKDDLVGAYLEREAAGYRAWFDAAAVGPGPRERLLALFDALGRQVAEPGCRGCPFQLALAELADLGLPGVAPAVAVKEWTRARLRELTGDLIGDRPGDADALADDLMLVLEGVHASVASLGSAGPAGRARALAARLLAGPGEG